MDHFSISEKGKRRRLSTRGRIATILVREDRPELRQLRTMETWKKRMP